MIKPPWLNKKINLSDCSKLKFLLRKNNLRTVCEEAYCPNVSECFSRGVITFIILGSICTRNCSFCGIKNGKPAVVDFDEPKRIKEAVKKLDLKYVVITSPTRDDLSDYGAGIFELTVKEIKSNSPLTKIELLIPDFLGERKVIKTIALCGAKVVSHNIETAPSLYKQIRQGANYKRSLKVLKLLKESNKNIFTKSGFMLGLGETEKEVINILKDLRSVNCDLLTIGQYLPPSSKSFPLKQYVEPSKFKYFKDYALELGFKAVKASPYTRSSYLAHSLIKD